MGIITKFIHSRPQQEIASLLGFRIAICQSAALVSGIEE